MAISFHRRVVAVMAKRPKPLRLMMDRQFEERFPLGDDVMLICRQPTRTQSLTTTSINTLSARCTNAIEGFRSIFKRGVVGTFHKVSAKYMPLYVAEFQFRYNNRANADIFGAMISGC